MQNVKIETSGTELVLRIRLDAPGTISKTGKSEIIASTHGNHKLPDGTAIGLNVYRPRG